MKNDDGRTAEGRDPQPETDEIGADRDRIAEGRDQRAEAHDHESDARDRRATARDERAEAREAATAQVDAGPAADRAGALRDRQGSASDRTQSADDRKASRSDRVASARERAAYALDDVTGAYRREPGLVVLERETAKAKRTVQPFTLTFVDVDGLKETNDSLGHAAGDQLLRNVADSIRAHLRSDDLVIRFGGDEFLCVMPDVAMPEAVERFNVVKADLSGRPPNLDHCRTRGARPRRCSRRPHRACGRPHVRRTPETSVCWRVTSPTCPTSPLDGVGGDCCFRLGRGALIEPVPWAGRSLGLRQFP